MIVVADTEGNTLKLLGEGEPRLLDFGQNAKFNDVLPDGRSILVSLREKLSGDFSRVGIFDIEKRTVREVLTAGYDARYVPSGLLLFVRGSALHAVRFDGKRGQILGEPVILQPSVATDSFFHQAQYAVSDTGVLAYKPGSDRSIGKIAWVNRDGKSEFLQLPDGPYGVFDLSPDGRKLAIQVGDVTDYLWIFDFSRKEGRRVPAPGDLVSPRWTPDGREIVAGLHSAPGQPYQLVSIDPTRTAQATVLYSSKEMVVPTAISSDRRLLSFYEFTRDGTRVAIKTIGEPSVVTWLRYRGYSGDFSPDGRWFAYASTQTGRYEIWIHSVETPDHSYQISVEGGVEPVWCHASGELFYRSGARWFAVRISTDGAPKWELPRLVWETDFIDTPGISYDVSSDGNRLLVSKRTTADVTDRIHLIQNFRSLLPRF